MPPKVPQTSGSAHGTTHSAAIILLNATIQLNASCNTAGKGEWGGRFLQRPASRQDPSPVPDPSPYRKQGTDGTVFRKGEDVTSQLNCHRVRWHRSDRKPIHQRLEPAASCWPSGVVRGPQIINTGHEERKKKKNNDQGEGKSARNSPCTVYSYLNQKNIWCFQDSQ